MEYFSLQFVLSIHEKEEKFKLIICVILLLSNYPLFLAQ